METQEFLPGAAVSYLGAVEAKLAAVDASDRAELMDDLRTHMAELLIEDENTNFDVALGSPGKYADELLVAAGFASHSSKKSKVKKWHIATATLALIVGAMWLGAASLIWQHNWALEHSNEPMIPDRFISTPDFVGMPFEDAFNILVNQEIAMCPEVETGHLDLTKARVVSQLPIASEEMSTQVQCVMLVFTSQSYYPGFAPSQSPLS